MRNGNLSANPISDANLKSLSYLWGMETITNTTPRVINAVSLSYLWGMETRSNIAHSHNPNCSPYPTYEEWKPIFLNSFWNFAICPYPTYEEWKHNAALLALTIGNIVLILPMRNGNIYFDAYSSAPNSVLILPMRNGNNIIFLCFNKSFQSLSYLWGMETPTSKEWKIKKEVVLILPMRNKKQRDARVARLYNLTIYDGYNMFL